MLADGAPDHLAPKGGTDLFVSDVHFQSAVDHMNTRVHRDSSVFPQPDLVEYSHRALESVGRYFSMKVMIVCLAIKEKDFSWTEISFPFLWALPSFLCGLVSDAT